MEYTYKFKICADVAYPIPGLTEMMAELTGQKVVMAGKGVDVCNTLVTSDARLTLEELEKVMDIVREGFEKQDVYSNVRVYFLGKEVIKDA